MRPEAAAAMTPSRTTMTMASNYNGLPRPAVVMARDGAARLIRRRETLDDLLAAEVL